MKALAFLERWNLSLTFHFRLIQILSYWWFFLVYVRILLSARLNCSRQASCWSFLLLFSCHSLLHFTSVSIIIVVATLSLHLHMPICKVVSMLQVWLSCLTHGWDSLFSMTSCFSLSSSLVLKIPCSNIDLLKHEKLFVTIFHSVLMLQDRGDANNAAQSGNVHYCEESLVLLNKACHAVVQPYYISSIFARCMLSPLMEGIWCLALWGKQQTLTLLSRMIDLWSYN